MSHGEMDTSHCGWKCCHCGTHLKACFDARGDHDAPPPAIGSILFCCSCGEASIAKLGHARMPDILETFRMEVEFADQLTIIRKAIAAHKKEIAKKRMP